MSVTITLPGSPPSPNQSTKAGSWHARAESRRQWRVLAKHATYQHVVGRPLTACTLDVLHVLPDARRRDIDNLGSAIKPILDGIVDSGLIADDSSAVIRSITHRVEVVRGVRETRITIHPIEED